MAKTLFVGNVSYNASEDDLREAFAAIGEVQQVRIITEPGTGRSRGFGFVEMALDEDAEKAVSALNGADLMGRALVVSVARPRTGRD